MAIINSRVEIGATGIPVAPISTLELMIATYVRQESAQAGEIIALLDARMSEFNLGRYQLDDNKQIVALEADQLMTAEQVIELLKANNPNAIIGDGGNLFELAPQFAEGFTQVYPNAVDILPIAQQQLSDGLAVNIETVDLVYLRGTEAWQKRKRLRTTEQEAN